MASDPSGEGRSGDSIAFDRAAAYYDLTRRMTPATAAATIAMLVDELSGRGRALEVGVGTGQIALPLHAAGIPMAGVDISRPMLDKLLDKSAGRRPFPLVHGDGAALPFRTSSFGGAVVRHVLHLVPAYEEVVEELLRVVRPGGVIVASAGWWSPISDELDELLSERERVGWAAGLDARDVPTQDRAFEARGAVARAKPPIRAPDPDTAGGYADAIEKDLFSWTWRLPEEDRLRAAEKVRRWATARGLGLDDPMDTELESRWRAYDIPG